MIHSIRYILEGYFDGVETFSELNELMPVIEEEN